MGQPNLAQIPGSFAARRCWGQHARSSPELDPDGLTATGAWTRKKIDPLPSLLDRCASARLGPLIHDVLTGRQFLCAALVTASLALLCRCTCMRPAASDQYPRLPDLQLASSRPHSRKPSPVAQLPDQQEDQSRPTLRDIHHSSVDLSTSCLPSLPVLRRRTRLGLSPLTG